MTPRPPLRWSDERGGLSSEYAGVTLVVAALIAALVLVVPSVGGSLVDGMVAAICRLVGEGCEGGIDAAYDPGECALATRSRTLDGSVKVLFVEVGGDEGYGRELMSDGTVHVTWTGGNRVGLTGGAGAAGRIALPSGGLRGGAEVSGAIAVGATRGETWIFHDPDEAEDFISRRAQRAALERAGSVSTGVGIVTGIVDLVRGGPGYDAPDRVYFEAGLEGDGSAGVGFGPAGASAEADLSALVGGSRDARTGEVTLYFAGDASLSGEAGVVLGRSRSGAGSAVYELVLDEGGTPTTFRTVAVRTLGSGGGLGQDWSLEQLARSLDSASGSFGAEGTERVVVTTELDLDDPTSHEPRSISCPGPRPAPPACPRYPPRSPSAPRRRTTSGCSPTGARASRPRRHHRGARRRVRGRARREARARRRLRARRRGGHRSPVPRRSRAGRSTSLGSVDVMSGMTVRRASRPGAARLAAVAVSALLAACSGADAASTDDAPEGFARYTADTYTFVYPEAWEIQAADDQVVDGRDVEIVGPVVTGGYAPGIGVASGDSLPADTSMGQRVAVFNLAADAEIAGREVLDEEAVDVPGAVGARRIEARYDSPGLGGEDVELRQLDVLAVREDGLQVDLRVGGPAADLDDAQVRTVLESLELRG